MIFQKKLEIAFLLTIFIAIVTLAYNSYKSYLFKNNDISAHNKERLAQKEHEILQNMQKDFGFVFQVPVVITDKIQGKLYGLTSYNNGKITIYLNKKVMRESMDYMVESVLAHEYAHALIFKLGHYTKEKDGHSQKWQKACEKLGGKECKQYVNSHEVIMAKMPF